VTTIDGQQVHFLHVRSADPDALPLVISHGYPSSFAEFADLIGPLTDPESHGARLVGRVPCRRPVSARLRVLDTPRGDRLEPRPECEGDR
jgi:hypothetical protein